MARMSLDTAIRLSAEVKGGSNITKVQRSLQDLARGSQTTAREMSTLRAATFQYARANYGTIAGIRNSVNAFRGLQEQAKIGSREFQRYGAEIQKLEGKLRGLDSTATAAGDSLGKKLATGLAAAGIGRGLQQITMQAGKFDAELRKAAAIEGGAGSFGVLRKEIEAVAAVAAGTPTEVAALATALSRAGFSAEQTTKALRGIVLGAEATDTAFADMGGIVGTVLKTFQVDASQTGSIVDVLVKSANSANQTVTDVGEAMSYAAGTASKLNVSVEDTAALIALFADAGVRASRAGTSLSTGLNRLQIAAGGGDSEMQNLVRGSQKMIDAMSVLGSQVLDTSGKLKPLDQTLIAIKRQMDTLNATDRAILAKAIFGEESGRAFESVLARSEQDIVRMFGKVRDAGGAAEETQKKMQGFDFSIKVLGGNVENLTNQVGGMIGIALKPLIDGLNTALSAAQKLPDPIKNIGAAAAAAGLTALGLAVAVNAVSGALALVGGASGAKAAIAGLANFTAVAGLAQKAVAALNLTMLANPWVLAAAGIIAATAAAYKFIEPFREFVNTYPERFKLFWGSIAADAQASFKRITDAANAMGQFLAKGVQNIANSFSTMFGWARDRAGEALRAIGVDGQWLAGAMQSVSATIGNAFSAAFEFVQSRWQQTISNMINYSNPFMGMLTTMGVNVGDAATRAMQTGQQRLQAAGVPNTYTVAGVTYDAATGRPVSGVTPFTPQAPSALPSAPSAPVLPAAGGGSAGGGGGSAAGATQRASDSIGAQIAKSIQQALNLTPAQAAGVVGNLMRESGLNPRINEGGAVGLPRGVGGYGLAQWTGSRQSDLVRFAGGPAAAGDMQTQLRFMVSELLGPESKALASLRRAASPEEAAVVFDRDYERSGIKALGERKANARQVFNEIEGAGPGAGLGDFASQLRDEAQAAQQLQEQQEAAQKQLQDYIATRAQVVVQLGREEDLLRATTDEQRRQLEYEHELDDINGRNLQAKNDLAAIEAEITRLGGIAETSAISQRLENEKQQELVIARLKYEQDMNDLLVERVRMMQELSREAAEAPAFQTQGMAIEEQIATLKGDLQEMTSISTLAAKSAEGIGNAFGNAFQELISGAASTREVLAGFFQDVAKNFAQMAAEIIAKQVQMIILQTILKALGAAVGGAGGGGFAPSDVGPFGAGGLSAAPSFDTSGLAGGSGVPLNFPRAMGGPVSPGNAFPVGERGPELFVPYQAGTIIPAETTEALEAINNASMQPLAVPFQRDDNARTQPLAVPFQRNDNPLSVPFLKSGGGADGTPAGTATIDVKFETVRIGEMDFVTRDEAQRIGRESAKQGAALAQKRLANNPTARRAVGLG